MLGLFTTDGIRNAIGDYAETGLSGWTSVLTTTGGGVTGLTVAGGKVAFPYSGVDGRPDRNHTPKQPLSPPKSVLSLLVKTQPTSGK